MAKIGSRTIEIDDDAPSSSADECVDLLIAAYEVARSVQDRFLMRIIEMALLHLIDAYGGRRDDGER